MLFTLREPCFSAAVDATINETVTDGVLVNKLICRIDHINEDVRSLLSHPVTSSDVIFPRFAK